METKKYSEKISLMDMFALKKSKMISSFLFIGILILGSFILIGCEGDMENRLEHLEAADAKTKAAVNIKAIDMELIAEGMISPLGLVEADDETGNLFVIDQIGKIWVIENGTKLDEPFLDVTDRMVSLNPGYDERGLLGLAFHPDYASTGRFFVYYTAPPNAGGPEPDASWNNISRISEFSVSGK